MPTPTTIATFVLAKTERTRFGTVWPRGLRNGTSDRNPNPLSATRLILLNLPSFVEGRTLWGRASSLLFRYAPAEESSPRSQRTSTQRMTNSLLRWLCASLRWMLLAVFVFQPCDGAMGISPITVVTPLRARAMIVRCRGRFPNHSNRYSASSPMSPATSGTSGGPRRAPATSPPTSPR